MPDTFEITNLLPGTAVRVKVRAFNLIGPSEWSDVAPEDNPEGFITKAALPCDPLMPRLVEGSLTSHSMKMIFETGRPNGDLIHSMHYRIADNAEMEDAEEWAETVE